MSKSSDSKPAATGGQIPIPKAARGGLKGFFRDVQRELKKVEWPTPPETNRLTGVVIVVCGIVTVVIVVMSFIADVMLRLIQGKL